jgi:small conductance mechanosensitive channel
MDYQLIVDTILMYTPRVLGAILILILGRIVAGWARKSVLRGLTKANVDVTLARFLARGAGILVLAFAVLAVLARFGIETTSFIALLGAAGLAVGLALQGTLSNFAAGVMLILFRPFQVGDLIRAAGVMGKVSSIDLFATKLDTLDNRRIILANSEIYGSTIENITYHPTRRVDVSVGTDYSADLKQVRSVLEKVPARIAGVLDEPASQIFLSDLGDSSINWQVRVWCNTADYWDVHQKVTHDVKAALDAAGIGIPFPQMDVHVDGALQQ